MCRFVDTVTMVLLSNVDAFVLRALPLVRGLAGGDSGINSAAAFCFPSLLKNPMVNSVLIVFDPLFHL
jgi:hypothetical protein